MIDFYVGLKDRCTEFIDRLQDNKQQAIVLQNRLKDGDDPVEIDREMTILEEEMFKTLAAIDLFYDDNVGDFA
jgi:hypothetical protein